MRSFLERLLDLGTSSLSMSSPSELAASDLNLSDRASEELLGLLTRKNGMYAFESALHIFPAKSDSCEIGLAEWNAPELWVNAYQGLANQAVFFAEDVFGGQFCIKDDAVHSFDPETGAFSFLAPNLQGWAELVLNDYEVLTGYPLAHEWQRTRGRLEPGVRLVPKIPFVAGGQYVLDNLYALESVKSMHLRANLAIQIKDLPDGAQIKWNVKD